MLSGFRGLSILPWQVLSMNQLPMQRRMVQRRSLSLGHAWRARYFNALGHHQRYYGIEYSGNRLCLSVRCSGSIGWQRDSSCVSYRRYGPGTNAGAAHPVSVGQEKADKVMMEKVTKDAEAYVRSICQTKGQERRMGGEISKRKCLHNGYRRCGEKCGDLVAASIDDFLKRLTAKKVETKKGKIVLKTKGKKAAECHALNTSFFHISATNVAYISS